VQCVATPAQTGIGPAVHPALSIGSTFETPAGTTTGDGQALRVLAARTAGEPDHGSLRS